MSTLKLPKSKPYSALSSLLGLGGSGSTTSVTSQRSMKTKGATTNPTTDFDPKADNHAPPTYRTVESTTKSNNSDQLCLLFPSYALRSSQDPSSDWTLRVKGRAFNKAGATRSFKFAHGVARRMAGTNRDAEELASLEQRLGFFFDNNSVDSTLNVEVVGLTTPGPMVLDYSKPFAEEPEELETDDSHLDSSLKPELGSHLNQSHDGLPRLSHSLSTLESNFLTTPGGSFASSSDSINSKLTAKVTVKNGHFNSSIQVPHPVVDRWHSTSQLDPTSRKTVVVRAQDGDSSIPVLGQIQLIEPEGISIISDIDDTIKDSGVYRGKKHVLTATFLQGCREVPGMSQVYQDWADRGASFHYVSNSPWELYPMLESFFQTFSFPLGSSHLKLWDRSHKALFYDPMASKRTSIETLFKDFPRRKFILIGDSGELDLELYTQLAKDFPDQVLRIFIRDVTTTKYPEFIKVKPPSFLTPRFLTPSNRTLFTPTGSLSHLGTSPTSSDPNSWSESGRWSSFRTSSPNDDDASVTDNDTTTPTHSLTPASPPIPIRSQRQSSQSSFTSTRSDLTTGAGNDPTSDLMERNPDYLTASTKLQRRVIKATLGLPTDLVSLFTSPTTLQSCPILHRHLPPSNSSTP